MNLFSCNDVISAKELVQNLEDNGIIHPPYDILLTCRIDRPLRTKAFLQWILPSVNWERLILTGTFPLFMVKKLVNRYKNSSHTIILNRKFKPEDMDTQFREGASFILGLGNYIQTGEKILSYLKKELI